MDRQSISVNQIIEIAEKLDIEKSNVLFVPDVNQLVLIIKEKTEKVKYLKEHDTLAIDVRYLEEHNALFIALRPDEQASDYDVGAIFKITEDLHNYLNQIATSFKTLELYTVGDDLETISARHIFTSDIAKFGLSQQLNKYQKE